MARQDSLAEPLLAAPMTTSLPLENAWLQAPGISSFDVAWGDVDGDGRLDLVCGNFGRNEVYLNTGDNLSIAPAAWSPSTSYATHGVALGDLDADGDLDLVCANYNAPNTVYLNEGGMFGSEPAWTSPDAAPTQRVVLGDVDGDGDLDVVFSNNQAPKQLYLNNAGVFGAQPVWASTLYEDTQGLALGDLNGDGRLDLACANFTSQLAESLYTFSRDVAGAGDVNGDGYDDVLVAGRQTIGGVLRERVWLYLGGPDMDDLADLVLTGEVGEEFGGDLTIVPGPPSIGTAGDMNGDGFDDFVVGAYANGAAGELAGRVYVFFGGANPDSSPDLVLNGRAGEAFGDCVASAGDVNGDGFDDLLVGAPNFAAPSYLDANGRAYLYLGGSVPDTTFDLAMTGDSASIFAWTVSGAGDVNGDGFDDFIVGAPGNDARGADAGEARLFFGGAAPDSTADMILGGQAGDFFGLSVAGVGDMNGDGFDDFAIGALRPQTGSLHERASRVHVFLGGASPSTVAALVVTGYGVAHRISGVGDVNGDGFDDLMTSDFLGILFPTDDFIGRAYLYLGRPVPDTSAVVVIEPPDPGVNFWFGWAESGAGDLNGDGLADIIIGAANHLTGSYSGQAFIYYGRGVPDATPDLTLTGGTGQVWTGSPNSVYLNEGGTFGALPSWRSKFTQFSWTVALGDVDDDGDLDACFGGLYGTDLSGPGPLTLYRNDAGSLTLHPMWASAERRVTRSIALADLDRDGDLDLAATSEFDFNRFYFNEAGSFPSASPFGFGDSRIWTQAIVPADIDSDGDPDLCVAVASSNGSDARNIVIRNNTDDNWFTSAPDWNPNPLSPSYGVALGDLDADGDLDLVFASVGRLAAYYTHDGQVETSPTWSSFLSYRGRDVALEDLNGDGLPEAVFATDEAPAVAFSSEGPTLSSSPVWTADEAARGRSVALGDVNLDGRSDLVIAISDENCSTSSPLSIFDSDTAYFSTRSDWDPTPPIQEAYDTKIVDLNGDLGPDIVSANVCDSGNTLRLNRGGSPSLQPDWVSPVRGTSHGVAVADLNGDARFDLVFAGPNDNQVYLATADSTLFALSQASVGDGAEAVALGDVDGDGDADAVFGAASGNRLHLNRGGLLDGAAAWSSDGQGTARVAMGDVDQDGDLDLVFANTTGLNTLYLGQRNRSESGGTGSVARLPQNGTAIRGVSFHVLSSTRYRVRFRAVDPESDPVCVYPEYRQTPARSWTPITFEGQSTRLGPLASSPEGVDHEFEWDFAALPITLNPIEIRLRWTPIPTSSVGLVRSSGTYLHELAHPPKRPRASIPSEVAFPTVTVGDTAMTLLGVRNLGSDVLHVTGLQFSSPVASTNVSVPFDVPIGLTVSVPLVLAPSEVLFDAGTVQVTTSDAFGPSVDVTLAVDVRDLDVQVRDLGEAGEAPLGQPLTLGVSAVPPTRIEGGKLFYRAAGQADFDSLSLRPFIDDFIATIPGNDVTEAGVEYYVRVVNSGVARVFPAGAPAALFAKAVTAPTQISAVAQTNSGSGYLTGIEVGVLVSLPLGALFESGRLHYREGGQTEFRSAPLMINGPFVAAAIPDSLVGSRGVEYWAEVRTVGGSVLTTPSTNPAGAPHVVRTTVHNLIEPDPHPGGAYRMTSVPLDFGPDMTSTLAVLLNDQAAFGLYDPVRWRCFRFSPADETYLELSQEDHESAFVPVPGRAFWLISRDAHRVDTAPIDGLSTPTGEPYSIALEPGWNQLGNPFVFTVAWDQALVNGTPVGQQSVVEPPVGWRDGAYRFDVTTLEPFEGYWVRNNGVVPVDLQIRPVELSAGPLVRHEDTAQGWRLNFALSVAGVRHDAAVAGVDPRGARGRDHFDRSAPPMAPEKSVTVYFPHADWAEAGGAYAVDIRGPVDAGQPHGQVWVFDAAKNFRENESGDEAMLAFDLTEVPAESEVYLFDRSLTRFVDLRSEPAYSFYLGRRPIESDPDAARFELLVGTEGFIRSSREHHPSLPFANRLLPNQPNPFRTDTMIRYELARRGSVRIQIFDSQGRRVRSLVDGVLEAGRYELHWDARDDQGRAVAAGIYFVRSTTAGWDETIQLVRLR